LSWFLLSLKSNQRSFSLSGAFSQTLADTCMSMFVESLLISFFFFCFPYLGVPAFPSFFFVWTPIYTPFQKAFFSKCITCPLSPRMSSPPMDFFYLSVARYAHPQVHWNAHFFLQCYLTINPSFLLNFFLRSLTYPFFSVSPCFRFSIFPLLFR